MSDAKRKKYDEKVERAIAGQLSSQLAGKIPNSKWGEEKPSKKTKVIPVEDDDEKGKEEKAGKKRGEKQAGHFYGSGEKMPAKETKEKKDKKEEKEKKEKKKKGDESPEKGSAFSEKRHQRHRVRGRQCVCQGNSKTPSRVEKIWSARG